MMNTNTHIKLQIILLLDKVNQDHCVPIVPTENWKSPIFWKWSFLAEENNILAIAGTVKDYVKLYG